MIYADNAATTRLDPAVLEAMLPFLTEDYSNPSQPYSFSRGSRKAIAKARETIAELLHAEPEEIFFTSGGTEGDNLAIIGGALGAKRRGMHLITTRIEHPAVLEAA